MKSAIALIASLTLTELALGAPCGKAKADMQVSGMGIDFSAEGASVECQYTKQGEALTGEFSIHLKELKTGMDMRDDHMREALGVAEFPDAKFLVKGFPMKSGPITGDLTLHGVTKPVAGWSAKVDGAKVTVTGPMKYTDYGLPKAAYKKAGQTLASVDEKVTIEVTVNL